MYGTLLSSQSYHLLTYHVLLLTVTQGLTGVVSALLQISTLPAHFIKKWFLGRTPRQAYAVTFLMLKVCLNLLSREPCILMPL